MQQTLIRLRLLTASSGGDKQAEGLMKQAFRPLSSLALVLD